MYQQLYSLLLLFVFFISCNGQKKTQTKDDNQETNKLLFTPIKQNLRLDTASQISEYVVEVFEDIKGNLWFGTEGVFVGMMGKLLAILNLNKNPFPIHPQQYQPFKKQD